MATHLVIPDSHAHPDHNNKRYEWLGKLIVDIKPDVVVDIGDWFDMDSLCSYEKGRYGYEKKRYKRDVEAGVEAMDILYSIVRRGKRKLPKFIRCLGNHENRINRAVSADPILIGTIGLSDLMSKEYGWEEIPFLDKVTVNGICYSHYFVSGVMGRPIGGENVARSLILKNGCSTTQGHMHTFDYAVRNNINGRSVHGLVCGVFQDYTPEFARGSSHLWSRGVVVKRDVDGGSYDIERISMERMKREYS